MDLRAFGLMVDGLREMRELAEATTVRLKTGSEQVEVAATKLLAWYAQLVAFGVIGRISGCLGARDLCPTYQSLLSSDRSVPNRLLISAIGLDHIDAVDEEELTGLYDEISDQPWTSTLLRALWLKRLVLDPPAEPEAGVISRHLKVVRRERALVHKLRRQTQSLPQPKGEA